jgi:hypothetical protein
MRMERQIEVKFNAGWAGTGGVLVGRAYWKHNALAVKTPTTDGRRAGAVAAVLLRRFR